MPDFTNKAERKSSAFAQQIKNILPALLMSGVISLGGIAVTVLIARLTGNPIWRLAKDPAQVVGYEPYIGMLSNWAVLLWFASAVICLFAEILLRRGGAALRPRLFLLVSGILSLTLALDDLFLFHDVILPNTLGLRESTFYLTYLVTTTLYILVFLRDIHQKDYILFWISFLLLFYSRGYPFLLPFLREYETPGDMLKYVGIVFWLAFFYRAALHEISATVGSKNTAR
ncbi:MAG: hypothetical protein HXY38_11135 [Chloroflexi bacterium]|nr:hypothetical protein [Chloroflexota bacterium]